MANEIIKELKTRIALRTGDFAYWTTGAGKDIELIKGEVCVCTVAAADNQATTAPTVLFKVCDTTGKKFADLKWVSALAADVYDWAKAANAPDEYDTKYAFEVKDGKLQVTETTYTNGQGGTPNITSYDFVTPEELTEILKNYYTKTEVDGLIQGVKDIVNGLDESVTTITKGTAISVEDNGTGNDHAYTVALDVEGAKTALGLQSAAYVTVDSLNVTAKGYADGKDGAIAEAKKAGTDAANALDAYSKLHEGDYDNAKIDELVQGAKDYADNNDANTEYHVEYDSDNKKIKLVAGADASKMEIDATAFIKDGMIQSVELVTEDDGGNKGQFLKITWNTDGDVDADDVTYVNVTTLVDVYVGENGDYVNVTVTSDNKIKADLTDAAKTKLNKVWEEVGVAAGLDAALKAELQKEIDDDIAAYDAGKNFGDIITHNAAEFAGIKEDGAKALADENKLAIDAINNAETGILAQAKAYSDSLNHEDTKYAAAADGGLKLNENNEFAINESVVFVLDCNW